MKLEINGNELIGTGEASDEALNALASLAGISPSTPTRRTRRFRLSGEMFGRTCRFSVTTEWAEPHWLAEPEKIKDGFLMFSKTGGSGRVGELKGEMPHRYYFIEKFEF